MASASVQAVCRRGLSKYCRRLAYNVSRYESSAVSSDLSTEHEEDPDAEIPLVPKHRDPHAVLKALSLTLTPLPHPLLMGGLSLADPMAPRTRALQMEYQRAREAGRKSAQYVTNRWPAMFPDVDSEPARKPPQGIDEEVLKDLISRKQTGRAMKLYQKLQEKGDHVSMETQNGLLELLAYYGIGNPLRTGKKGSGEFGEGVTVGDVVTEGEEGMGELDQLGEELGKNGSKEATAYLEREGTGGVGYVSEEERSLKDRTHLMQFHEMHRSPSRIWSMDNQAERFFAEMPERNGGIYDALILGLVKFRNFDRAWDVFTEMREGHYQASVATYNSLLYVIGNSSVTSPWEKAMSLVQEMYKEPVVQPNITTMNLLLEISTQTGGEAATELSLKIFREALHLGLEPNLTTFLALLRAHVQSADGSILYEMTDYLEKNQHILQVVDTQDIFFFTVAMETARNMLDHELATRLRRLCDRDNWILCQNLTLFVCYYLATITGRVPVETLRGEYHRLVPGVVLPMEWVYGIMFRACEEQDDANFALELWNHMMRFHVKLSNVSTFSRFCGSMPKTIFPSEVDEWLKALMQALYKCQEIDILPPSVMIAQIIRLHCLKNELEKAWEYFSLFEEYDRKPTFQALVSLVKAYSSIRDVEKTVQLLSTMVKLDMVLPTTFVRDLCWKAGVSETVRSKLVHQFSKGASTKSSPEVPKASDIEQ